MLAVFLFILYLGIACFFINRIGLVSNSGLGIKTVIFLFLSRIAAGCVLGLVNHYLANGSNDYDGYNALGYREFEMLFSDPHKFFTDIFVSNYSDRGEFFGSDHSYWNDLRTNIIFKIIGIIDIFSRGNYFVNSIFFNFVAFIANVALYRVFIHIYPMRKTAVIIGCFLLPSTLYFSSGIHKDLIVFSALCFFCYALYFSLEEKFTVKRVITFCLAFLCILFIRNFIAVLLLPPLLGWIWKKKNISSSSVVRSDYFVLGAIISGCLAIILCMHFFWGRVDPLQIIADKQHAFLAGEKANTQFAHIDTLQADINSFRKAGPTALRHSFLSPLPGEFNRFYSNLFSVEMMLYWLLFIMNISLFPTKEKNLSPEFISFSIWFAFWVLLFTGYVSVAAGALVRYRSIYLPFLMVPIICGIDFSRVKRLFGK